MYLFLHRKDLRTFDLSALEAIARRGGPGIHLLILDPALLTAERLHAHSGRTFLRAVSRLRLEYHAAGQTLHLLYGEPAEVVEALLTAMPIAGLVLQADFTPYAVARDAQLEEICKRLSRGFKAYDDAPLADMDDFREFAKRTEPYKVFTPFYRMWNSYMRQAYRPSGGVTVQELTTVRELDENTAVRFALPSSLVAELDEYTTDETQAATPQEQLSDFLDGPINDYAKQRDRYAVDGGSGLARWINHGVLSPRRIYEACDLQEGTEAWVRQLAWRDFYLMQARQNPDFFTYEQQFEWSGFSEAHLTAWIEGRTGIPIIDAAMTQLRETGELPNRLRMVTAMFLTKNLLCPFTKGEQYFRLMLADYDNVLNRGSWLWSSSLGYDAAPYFRIMNPVTQSMTHNPSGSYIRQWLPHLAHLSDKEIHQPQPEAIVDLRETRARAIEVYRHLLQQRNDERQLDAEQD